LLLPRGGNSLAEAKTGEIVVGRKQEGKPGYHYTWKPTWLADKEDKEKRSLGKFGIWTGGISDCIVVCAAYYSGGAWTQFWFQHVPGGLVNDIMESIKEGLGNCPETNQRYAVVAAGGDVTSTVSEELMTIGLPAENVKTYVTGTQGRGFAFGINFSDDVFGEVTHTGAQLPDDPNNFFIL
jgi:hypothetical protein